jgi:hypothetical protein
MHKKDSNQQTFDALIAELVALHEIASENALGSRIDDLVARYIENQVEQAVTGAARLMGQKVYDRALEKVYA